MKIKESIVNLKQNILLIELRKIELKYLTFIIEPCDKECYYLTEIKFKVHKYLIVQWSKVPPFLHHFRPRDVTPGNCFFQMYSYPRAY